MTFDWDMNLSRKELLHNTMQPLFSVSRSGPIEIPTISFFLRSLNPCKSVLKIFLMKSNRLFLISRSGPIGKDVVHFCTMGFALSYSRPMCKYHPHFEPMNVGVIFLVIAFRIHDSGIVGFITWI